MQFTYTVFLLTKPQFFCRKRKTISIVSYIVNVSKSFVRTERFDISDS